MAGDDQQNYDLRAYAVIDSMQPQYAAFLGTEVTGDLPLATMAELIVEISPGAGILPLLDIALKQTSVKPGLQIVEREFGLIELHSFSIADIQEAGMTILSGCGLQMKDRKRPKVISSGIITNVSPHQAQLINKSKKGALLLPSESLFTMEVEPAAYITLAANQTEKVTGMKLIDFSYIGRFGRLLISGMETEIRTARTAAEEAIRLAQK